MKRTTIKHKNTQCGRVTNYFYKPLSLSLALLILSACTTYEYHETKNVPVNRVYESQEAQINEDTLLDVGIVLFDAGVDILDEESAAYSNLRESEAVWFSSQLKKSLEKSNAWGIVRTVPNADAIMDLMVRGKIIDSNGEILSLQIEAADASGRSWLSKEYFQRASAYAYNPEIDIKGDPFKSLFNEIANDLFDIRSGLSSDQLIMVRNIAKVRFAQSFAPASFEDFIVQDDNGSYQLQRVPAENDPMIQRIERIGSRNDLFLDVVQDYYRAFNKNMSAPYTEWRRLSYKDVIYERQLRKQARQEKIAGVAIMAGGLLATGSNSRSTRIGGTVGLISGAGLFRKGFGTQTEASLHAESLREMGESLELELEPSVIDLQVPLTISSKSGAEYCNKFLTPNKALCPLNSHSIRYNPPLTTLHPPVNCKTNE